MKKLFAVICLFLGIVPFFYSSRAASSVSATSVGNKSPGHANHQSSTGGSFRALDTTYNRSEGLRSGSREEAPAEDYIHASIRSNPNPLVDLSQVPSSKAEETFIRAYVHEPKYTAKISNDNPDLPVVTFNRDDLKQTNWFAMITEAMPQVVTNEKGEIKGVALRKVRDAGLLDTIGIQEGDIVLSLNGRTPKNLFEIPAIVTDAVTGPRAELVLEREGKTQRVMVTAKDFEKTQLDSVYQDGARAVLETNKEFAKVSRQIASAVKDQQIAPREEDLQQAIKKISNNVTDPDSVGLEKIITATIGVWGESSL